MPFRVLVVCSKPPFPSVDGGTRAIAELVAGLAGQGHAVHVLALATRKHPDLRGVPPAGVVQETIAVDDARALSGLSSLWPSRAHPGSELPFSVARFLSPRFARRLGQLLEEEAPDVVQFEGLHVAPYQRLAHDAGARVVVRAHNVDADLWRQRARTSRWPLSSWLGMQAERVERLEVGYWRSAHAVAAISPAVARACSAATAAPVIDLPVGLAVPPQPPPITDPSRLFHIGAMDWAPTADGITWFLADVWPRILAKQPSAVFHLAGRRVAQFAAGHRAPNVVWDGEVADADAYVRGGGVLIAPVRTGSGVRVKIIEAMAQGRAIVTTSAGAEGLDCVSDQHLLVADDAAGLAEQVLRCLASPALVRGLGAAAHRLAATRFDRDVLTTRLVRLYVSLVSASQSGQRAASRTVNAPDVARA
ncbi:MAG: glycosyltransferase [Vicinamibacterales bacterium]